jgi:hypothetical protein
MSKDKSDGWVASVGESIKDAENVDPNKGKPPFLQTKQFGHIECRKCQHELMERLTKMINGGGVFYAKI